MTDNELNVIRQNIACPQFGDDHYGGWGILTLKQRKTIYRLLEEITRQKAEIERLLKDSKRLKKVQMQLDDAMKMYSTIKAEAIKEFAERLRENAKFHYDYYANISIRYVEVDAIDNLVKEMVGDV